MDDELRDRLRVALNALLAASDGTVGSSDILKVVDNVVGDPRTASTSATMPAPPVSDVKGNWYISFGAATLVIRALKLVGDWAAVSSTSGADVAYGRLVTALQAIQDEGIYDQETGERTAINKRAPGKVPSAPGVDNWAFPKCDSDCVLNWLHGALTAITDGKIRNAHILVGASIERLYELGICHTKHGRYAVPPAPAQGTPITPPPPPSQGSKPEGS